MIRKIIATVRSRRCELPEDRGEVDIPEISEISWRNYLKGFNEEIYPIFEKHGISRGEALICWTLNRLENSIEELIEELRERAM